MSKKTLSTLLQLIIFLGLGIALVVWQYKGMSAADREHMFRSIKDVKLIYLVPVAIVSFLSHFFRALRWKVLLKPLRLSPSTVNTTLSVLIGYLVNLLVPRAGEVAKCSVLAKYEKVPADKLVGTIVAERAFDLVCLVIIALITLSIQHDIVYEYASSLASQIKANLLTTEQGGWRWGRIGVLIGIVLAFSGLFYYFIKKKKTSAVSGVLKGIWEGLRAIMKIERKGLFLLYTVLIWASYTLVLNIGFFAMKETEHIAPLASLSIIVFGSLAMIVTPGGIGAYPPIVASILSLYGISYAAGAAFGWLSWLAQTLLIIVFGMISLIILPLYNYKNHGNHKEATSRS